MTLKVVFESRVTWAISLPILVFLGLSVLDLGPMYATDRQTDVRRQMSDRRQTKASLDKRTILLYSLMHGCNMNVNIIKHLAP